MREIDLRDVPARELLGAALAAYSELSRGDEVALLVSSFDAGFRMGLVEAGAKHRAERLTERAWRLTLRGGAPGIHHVVAGARGDVWTCRRRAETAPELIPA